FAAAALIALFGDEHATIFFFAVCLLGVIALVLFGPDPETQLRAEERERGAARAGRAGDDLLTEDTGEAVTGSIPVHERIGVFRTMWRYRGVLGRLGLAAASLSSVRS